MEILSKVHVALALSELGRGLDGLSSCFNLVPPGARPMRERLGLELARAEARRAARLAQNLKLLLDDPPLARDPVNLIELLRRALDAMGEELRLAQVTVSVEAGIRAPDVRGDASTLELAVEALLGALVAMIETLPTRTDLQISATERDGAVSLRAHVGAGLSAAQIPQLFDLDWVDRPGGIAASVGLTAARRVAQLHGGRADAVAHPTGGFVLGLTLPAGD